MLGKKPAVEQVAKPVEEKPALKESPVVQPPPTPTEAGLLSVVEAAKRLGDRVTVQFVVASVGGKTYFYLNSSKEFQSKENLAVALSPKLQTGPWSNPTGDMFLGKLIRATGVVKVYKDAVMVEVGETKDLEVVEVLTPEQAAKKLGERVTVLFVVESAGGKTNLYLNSTKDFTAKDNFAVVLTPKVQAARGSNDPLVGKTIRATGLVKQGQTAPVLELADARELEILEK